MAAGPRQLCVLVIALAAVLLAACTTEPSAPAASLLPLPVATTPNDMAQRWQRGRALFEYDRSRPLNLAMPLEPTRRVGRVALYDATYESPAGGLVPAWIVLPEAKGAHPAVIIMHGLPAGRDDAVDVALDFGEAGVASILIDAPFNRPGRSRTGSSSEIITFTAQDRDEQIQLILDLRRAIDVLGSLPQVDERRVGYLGISYGAAMGGLLAGVEDRIAAYVLAVGDGGLVEHFLGPDDTGGRLLTLPAEERATWIAAMEPIEPLYYVGHATAPLFFLAAAYDENVPRSDAERYHTAAPDAARVEWYDSGHDLRHAAQCDTAAWLAGHLAFDAGSVGGCAAIAWPGLPAQLAALGRQGAVAGSVAALIAGVLLAAFLATGRRWFVKANYAACAVLAIVLVPPALAVFGRYAETGHVILLLTVLGLLAMAIAAITSSVAAAGRLDTPRVTVWQRGSFAALIIWMAGLSVVMLVWGRLPPELGWFGLASVVVVVVALLQILRLAPRRGGVRQLEQRGRPLVIAGATVLAGALAVPLWLLGLGVAL